MGFSSRIPRVGCRVQEEGDWLREMMNRNLIISLLCCLIAIPTYSAAISGRGLPVARPNLGLRGGSEGAVDTANRVEGASGVEVGSSEGVEKLKTVLEAACDPSQTPEQKEASKASILEMVSDRWGQLPKEKQDDLKKFALQQLGQGKPFLHLQQPIQPINLSARCTNLVSPG
jgi:hypothetical protein